MLEKPDIADESITAQLYSGYELLISDIEFLPLGADVNTAAYRIVSDQGVPYFLKLRRGAFDDVAVILPAFLKAQGINQIIAPIETISHQLWMQLDAAALILYPFVEGQNGYEQDVSDRQWTELGTALQRIHTIVLPGELSARLPRETYSPHYRLAARDHLAFAVNHPALDPAADKLVRFMIAKKGEIQHILDRAEALGQALQRRELPFVLCHADLHAGNVLLGAQEAMHIVDWDNPILAPKERDLMFIGMGGVWHGARQERLFYQGYGPTQIDRSALAYYRYERIVQDIAAFCEQIFSTLAGGDDREQSVHYLMSSFGPDAEVEVANSTDSMGA